MRSKIILGIGVLFVSGCIFGSGGAGDNNGFDLGERDSGVDQGNAADTGATDAGGGDDVGSPPDMATGGDDAATPDAGGTEDVGPDDAGTVDPPDMGPAPFEVLREVEVSGMAAQPGGTIDVSMFADGFLAGYVGPIGATRIGWYRPDSASAVDIFTAVNNIVPSMALVGREGVGYGAFLRPNEEIYYRFQVSATTADELTVDTYARDLFQPEHTLEEVSAGIYTVTEPVMWVLLLGDFSSRYVDTRVIDDDIGFPSTNLAPMTSTNISLADRGGAGPDFWAAGVLNDNYQLVHGRRPPNTSYQQMVHGCAAAPSAADRQRVISLVDRWAVIQTQETATTNGLALVRCDEDAAQRVEIPIALPPGVDDIQTFDIAEESKTSAFPVIAFLDDQDAYIGLLDFDFQGETASFERSWRVPDANGFRIRVAENTVRGTYGMLVQRNGGADLYMVEAR